MWTDIRPWKRALARCTPQTTREEWDEIFQAERVYQRLLWVDVFNHGTIGQIYGVRVYDSRMD
jgi:hypothetical protein